MGKALAIMMVIGLGASIALPAQVMVASWVCDRDNANDTVSTFLNYGGKSNVRWCKDKQEGTHYADWSEAQLEDLWAQLNNGAPPPYMHVRYALTGASWEAPVPGAVIWFGAFMSETDWDANESCNNINPTLHAGACNSFADDNAGVGDVDWNNVPGTTFWQLPELTNSVPFVGFIPSPGPGTPYLNRCDVDLAVVNALVNDPLCRGLRSWDTQWQNFQVYNRGQWGCPGVAARLELWVPEPGSLVLLVTGGIGVLLRKRR